MGLFSRGPRLPATDWDEVARRCSRFGACTRLPGPAIEAALGTSDLGRFLAADGAEGLTVAASLPLTLLRFVTTSDLQSTDDGHAWLVLLRLPASPLPSVFAEVETKLGAYLHRAPFLEPFAAGSFADHDLPAAEPGLSWTRQGGLRVPHARAGCSQGVLWACARELDPAQLEAIAEALLSQASGWTPEEPAVVDAADRALRDRQLRWTRGILVLVTALTLVGIGLVGLLTTLHR